MNDEKTTTSTSEPSSKIYNNNPFFLAVDGIELLFKYAKPIAITMLTVSIILTAMSWFSGSAPDSAGALSGSQDASSTFAATNPFQGGNFELGGVAIVIGVIIALAVMAGITLFMIFVAGIMDFTASSSAQKKTITLRDAFAGVGDRFWPYIKLRVLIAIKTFLWTLLFVIPGIYFANRYKLAGVAFFAENKTGNTAIKESLALTKNAWITTFATYGFLNLITFGAIQILVDTGASAKLYRNYRKTVDTSASHPDAHWISWVFLVGLFGLLVLLALIIIVAVASFDPAQFQNMPADQPTWTT